MVLVIMFIAISLIAVSCAKPAPVPSPAPAPAPAPAPSPTPTPAPAAEAFHWVYQTGFDAAETAYSLQERMLDRIGKSSGGRLIIDCNSGGAIVPAGDELQATVDGILDMCNMDPGWMIGTVPTGGLYAGMVGSGLSAQALAIWFRCGGGMELLKRSFANYDVVIPQRAPHADQPEVWCHSTVPLNSLEDLKGLKMRTSGDGGAVLSRMGVSVQSLPGGEIYGALQSGVIDALEYCDPSINWEMGFQEVAKYMYLSQSRAATCSQFECINKDRWNELPEDLQNIVKAEIDAARGYYWEEVYYSTLFAVQKFKDYGCIVKPIPTDIEKEFQKQASQFYTEKGDEDPLFKEIVNSLTQFQELYDAYTRSITPSQ